MFITGVLCTVRGAQVYLTLFSYMLWHIELKFCIWFCFTVLQIKLECCQFALIFVGVMPLLECRILKIQFSALFSYTLWHIELKFCISLCFTVLQIKFECCHVLSNFVGVVPLLELRLLEIHSFRHFSLTCFDISNTQYTGYTQFSTLFSCTLWLIELKFYIWLCFTVLQIKFECCQFPSKFIPLSECRILKIQNLGCNPPIGKSVFSNK